ncbi:MAG: aminopeptidase P N-terminal domain-containing protein [Thermoplasmatota archaeon]
MRSEVRVGPPPQLPSQAFAARRRAVARSLGPGAVAVIATHEAATYSNDVEYLFRPQSDFWYLTGFAEPESVLVLDGSGESTLFLRDRRPEAEIWTGRRLGVAAAPEELGVDRAFDVKELGKRLPWLTGRKAVHLLSDHNAGVRRHVARAARHLVPDPKRGSMHVRHAVAERRLMKEPAELRMLRRACNLGVEAHRAAREVVRPDAREYEVEAAFAHHARRHGSTGCGYASICGAGENGAVLHYVTNLSRLRAKDLLLVDAGCEWGYYTSDITRTYPVGGRFTRLQEQLYTLVHDAQKAGLKAVRPGALFAAPHQAAARVLCAGLIDLGLLMGPFEAAMKAETYRQFFMHGTSHWLGLDVHDAGGRMTPAGKPRRLREGMVLTVEPGLYFNADYAVCPPGTQGIGIRIEDDVVVRSGGALNLTGGLPSRPEDVSS